MSTADKATLETLEYQLKRAQGRYDLHRTVLLADRIERLQDAINFIKNPIRFWCNSWAPAQSIF